MRLLSLPIVVATIILATSLVCQSDGAQGDISTFLDLQNMARFQLKIAPLIWNDTLATYAETYATKYEKACNHPESGGPYGENTATGKAATTLELAVLGWVSEEKNYDYKSNSCINGTECTHYTQVVWKRSVEMGCAKVVCGTGWPFVVCEYYPKGNIKGQWPY